MVWFFHQPESVFPELISEEEETEIVETEYDGCAWCGTGEGCCSAHLASLFAQSAARKAEREAR